jgi:hypothetical protein
VGPINNRTSMFVTIICSKAPNSGLPQDWCLGYEGIADQPKIQAKVTQLLRQFARVKIFSQKICIGDFRRGRTVGEVRTVSGAASPESVLSKSASPSSVLPVSTQAASGARARTLDSERQRSIAISRALTRQRRRDSSEKPEIGKATALKVGDRIKVGGHVYRVDSLSPDTAVAVPIESRRHLRPLQITPPVTSATVRLAAEKVQTAVQKPELRRAPSRSARGSVRKQATVVAVSASGGAQINYSDNRWSLTPVAGGRSESNRRRH